MAQSPQSIVLNLAEFAALVTHRALVYRVGDRRVEIKLSGDVGAKRMIAAVLDIMGTDGAHSDPPEAREFLPRGSARKAGK
jgi:hypothetical protein